MAANPPDCKVARDSCLGLSSARAREGMERIFPGIVADVGKDRRVDVAVNRPAHGPNSRFALSWTHSAACA